MSRALQTHLPRSRTIARPTYYVTALLGEYSDWAFDEERAPQLRGHWRSQVFCVDHHTPLDLEIGTGIGQHFAHWASINKDRTLLGIEVKFKPLIQAIRRALRCGCTNARMVRFNAAKAIDLFGPDELNNVFIHFPDPWEKKWSTIKHRLIKREFLNQLYGLQRVGSFLEIKTDSQSYFDAILKSQENGLYTIERVSRDLHNSPWSAENFVTPFEEYFLKAGLPIAYLRLAKN